MKHLLSLIFLLTFSTSLLSQSSYEEALQFYKNGAYEMAYHRLENISETDPNYKKANRLKEQIAQYLREQTTLKLVQEQRQAEKRMAETSAFIKFADNTSDIYVDSVNITDIENLNYIQILGYRKGLFTHKVTIYVDYGQFIPFWEGRSSVIEDEKGNRVTFMGMVDALNFFENNGWQFINETKYTVGNQNVSHFLLRRKR